MYGGMIPGAAVDVRIGCAHRIFIGRFLRLLRLRRLCGCRGNGLRGDQDRFLRFFGPGDRRELLPFQYAKDLIGHELMSLLCGMGIVLKRGAEDGLRAGHVRIIDVAVFLFHGLQEGVHGPEVGVDDPVKARGKDIKGIVVSHFHDDRIGIQFPDQLKDLFITGLKIQQCIPDGGEKLRDQRGHAEHRVCGFLNKIHGSAEADGTDGIHVFFLGIFRSGVRFAGTQLKKDPLYRQPQVVDTDAHGDEVGFRQSVPDLFLQYRKLFIDVIRMYPVVHVVVGDRVPIVTVLQEHEHLLRPHAGGAVGVVLIRLQRIGHDLAVGSLHRHQSGIDPCHIGGQ